MGRPEKPIDWKIFEQLCHIQCTHDEIANFLHIAKATLYERACKEYEVEDFPTIYKRFTEPGKCSLRRNQFRMSEKNASMAIWLGKQYLGQKDHEEKREVPNQVGIEAEHKILSLSHIISVLEKENMLLKNKLNSPNDV